MPDEQEPQSLEPEATTPRIPSAPKGAMLPGMAAIGIFALSVAMITAFQMIRDHSLPTAARYAVLLICTAVVAGVYGMLRMRRWGWALVSGGCLFGALANFIAFHLSHYGGLLVEGMFALVFFLYLSRTEVRERLR
jgi:hypothetical protein